ncbi:hypothetical protein [Gelidibacter japonicus]|uniref:hypothetical protein n=1 Tax=Gelidibacter japonicus TaxID=1962232 RepID=UPI0013CF55F6|nr:hypothetical protein [Gelidibacter japonicus]
MAKKKPTSIPIIIIIAMLTLFFNCSKDNIQQKTNYIQNTQESITYGDSIFTSEINAKVEIQKNKLRNKLNVFEYRKLRKGEVGFTDK